MTDPLASRAQAVHVGAFAGLCFVGGLILCGTLLSAVALGVTGAVCAWYFLGLGRSIAIIETVALIAALQWLLGPALAYHLGWGVQKYHMYVTEGAYFGFVIPAYLLLLIGLVAAAPRVDLDRFRAFVMRRHQLDRRLALALFGIGVAASFVGDSAGSILGFVLYLMGQLKFVGVIYLIVFKSRWRWIAALAAFLLELSISAEAGMFHNILLWGALVLSFLCQDLRLKSPAKAAILLGSVLAISALQNVKADYRTLIEEHPDQAGIASLVSLAAKDSLSGVDQAAINSRINEGWIISAVMQHVPAYLPYQGGRTVWAAVGDSLVPRALVSKAAVDQSAKFHLFTGLPVALGTTFGVSILGEAWANFGPWGALFMGVVGLFYGLILRAMIAVGKTEPTIVLWTPLLFLQAIKAETELAIVLNHLVKSFIFIVALYFTLKPMLQASLRSRGAPRRPGRRLSPKQAP
jgi:hypothetical protein